MLSRIEPSSQTWTSFSRMSADVLRLAVGREAHQLVLAAVHLEAAEVRERRVEEADRVREPELREHVESVAAAEADRGRRPLPHAVHREDGRLLERRRVERRRRVRLVVLGEEDPAREAQLLADALGHPEPVRHPERHRLQERGEAARRVLEIRLEEPLELQERLVVEGDVVERSAVEPARREAVARRVVREIRRRASFA